jgi:hypothetical protein
VTAMPERMLLPLVVSAGGDYWREPGPVEVQTEANA